MKTNSDTNHENKRLIYVILVSVFLIGCAYFIKINQKRSSLELAIERNIELITTEKNRIGVIPDSLTRQQETENAEILKRHLPKYAGWDSLSSTLIQRLHLTCTMHSFQTFPIPSFHIYLGFSDSTSYSKIFYEGEALFEGDAVVVHGVPGKKLIIQLNEAVREAQDSFIKRLRRIPN